MPGGTKSLSLASMSSESQPNGNGLGLLKKLGAAAGATLAIIALFAWAIGEIRKPIMQGLESQQAALAEESKARIAAQHELSSSLQATRIGQIYMLDAMAAPPNSQERDRIVARAKRILLEGPRVPDER